MPAMLSFTLLANAGTDLLGLLLVAVLFIGLILLPGSLFGLLLHFFLSLPMRRRDRALMFLDLLETALQRGESVEQAILAVAESRDRVMGLHFFIVAAQVEDGDRLGAALEKTPRFLPPQVTAMLQAGERMGNLRNVLPACRETLRSAPDSAQTSVHYMVAMLMVYAPISIGLIGLLRTFVFPKFKEVAAGTHTHLYPVTGLVLNHSGQLILAEASVFTVLLLGVIVYVGGPGLVRWFQYRAVPVVDWISWRLPWKHKGLLRTFSAMLSVLLDNGVPEPEAVRLAGEATANEICRRRAGRVLHALQQGASLSEAMRKFDDTGEFHWRLTNAIHSQGGFLPALHGWHQALDGKAFQQEEAAAQTLTSGLVILNGIITGLIVTGLFGALIAILKGALLAS